MIEISLSVFGIGKEPINKLSYSLRVGTTILDLLHELDEKTMLPMRFGEQDDYQDLLIFVNRENVMSKDEEYRTLLNNQDRVVVLSAMAGG